ncbi:glycoside hydrolase family 3 N-terminal domain-containing protein [Falsigemmobacter intermedius]|uniref:beta-N-acetylhexosaminidase n=1 Tax=Falsigemmobacter intermedius TaxID=1553448 RepID=A0A3S4XEK3_9RHOB|nr:glycoside hydrolase family 3 N-terminal domain-containing protein [Falsigemmobacter intermedius]RWY34926.1 glycoside hydrolase family 3 protein [Falsigemmobacter intermedius]
MVVGYRGRAAGDGDVDLICHMLERRQIGGVLLLRRNISSPDQLSRLSRALRDAAGDLPPIIAIDQEGGRVSRVGPENGFLQWHSAAALARKALSAAELQAYWAERAWELSAAGVNVNFAPVVDLNVNTASPVIGRLGRAFARDPESVILHARAFVEAHRQAGVRTTLKHFPGHGSAATDSHIDTADVTLTWRENELIPYQAIARAGLAEGVMVGHLLHHGFSDTPWLPTSLSVSATRWLRNNMGPQIPTFTDDLQMTAVEALMPLETAVLTAMRAEHSFIVWSNYRRTDRLEHTAEVLRAVETKLNAEDYTLLLRQLALSADYRNTLR